MRLSLFKSLQAFCFLLTLWLGHPPAIGGPDGSPEPPAELDELVAEALSDHPAILLRQARTAVLASREPQRTQPADPRMSLGLMNLPYDSFSLRQDGMSGLQLSLSQRFYWPGTLSARARTARAEVREEQALIPVEILDLWMAAISPHNRLIALDRRRIVLVQQKQLLDTLRDTARSLFSAGVLDLTEVLRIDTARSRLDQQILELEREQRLALVEINGLLARPLDAPVPIAPASAPVPTDRAPAEWLSDTIEHHPALAALESRREVLGALRQEARRHGRPMFDVGLTWTFRFPDGPAGTDMVSLMVGSPLPLFSSREARARLDELEASSLQLDRERQEILRELTARIGIHLEALARIEEELDALQRTLIPQGQQTFDTALAHFTANHTRVEVLLEVGQHLLDLELMKVDLISTHDLHRAYLQALTVDSAAIRSLWQTHESS
ncbi:MAG: TolC family protein [Bradymonadales bacterium]|nr:TolC family protein [Bradymonadales bacterium]